MIDICTLFLEGAIPNEGLRRFLLHMGLSMLQAGETQANFRFETQDETPAGEGRVSTKGETVVFGSFVGIKCELTAEIGILKFRATVLIKPRTAPEHAEHAHFGAIPTSYFFQHSHSPMAEA